MGIKDTISGIGYSDTFLNSAQIMAKNDEDEFLVFECHKWVLFWENPRWALNSFQYSELAFLTPPILRTSWPAGTEDDCDGTLGASGTGGRERVDF